MTTLDTAQIIATIATIGVMTGTEIVVMTETGIEDEIIDTSTQDALLDDGTRSIRDEHVRLK